jgi:hypothetical protein
LETFALLKVNNQLTVLVFKCGWLIDWLILINLREDVWAGELVPV